MDPKIAKKTQDTLGKIIKKPPLTDKLLAKPPFRFLHDIVTSVIKTTGFMKGLHAENELNSENVKDKDSKIAFLQKVIDYVSMVSGKSVTAKPGKIVAGHEPEKTNELLVVLAHAINKQVDNDEYMKKFKNKDSSGGEEKKDKEKERSKRREKESDEKEGKDREEKKHREKSRDGDRERKEKRDKSKHREEKEDRHKDREDRHKDKEDRHKDREERHKDKEDRHRDREERHKDKEERHKDREERHRERRSKKKDEEGKENESPDVNGEKDDRIPRPTSAKGSRRRREGRRVDSDEEDESPARHQRDSNLQETELPPQIMAARKQARPPSARPAPPRPKTDVTESEPTMRLGTGKPTNLIVDNDKDDEDDDDDNFLVEDSAIPPPEPEQPVEKKDGEEEEEHGGLVKKMLETKKELEQQPTPAQRKVDIERSAMSDAARRKQREQVQKEIDKLRTSIQGLTRSANPLGKIMDYVQEDLDSMQQELEKWKAENKEHAQSLKREKGVTDRAVEPLKAQLSELEQAIKDQLESSATVKANILRNDHKIDKMLKNIARSS